jgi:hypothetical protein
LGELPDDRQPEGRKLNTSFCLEFNSIIGELSSANTEAKRIELTKKILKSHCTPYSIFNNHYNPYKEGLD